MANHRTWFVFTASLLFLATTGRASADSITDMGSVYTLELLDTVSSNEWIFGYGIDARSYSGSGAGEAFIDSVSFKVVVGAGPQVISSVSLVSAPGGTSAWTIQPGGQDSGGCNGHGNGFVCAMDTTAAPTDLASSIYLWVFDVIGVPGSSLETAPLGASVKADYVTYTNGVRDFQSQTSREITLQVPSVVPESSVVPEPSTVVLLGTGMAGAAIVRRRRLKPMLSVTSLVRS